MRIRRIAVLIDGGFFLKRIRRLLEPQHCSTPEAVAESARILCKRHVQALIHEKEGAKPSQWLDHVYRLFYYDAKPFTGVAHHPIGNRQIKFENTEEAKFRRDLFVALRRKRKFALRLGHVSKEDGWKLNGEKLTKRLLQTRDWADLLEAVADHLDGGAALPEVTTDRLNDFRSLVREWKALSEDNLRLGMRQKGVDMRIGIDIATLTLKQQVDSIVLVTGAIAILFLRRKSLVGKGLSFCSILSGRA